MDRSSLLALHICKLPQELETCLLLSTIYHFIVYLQCPCSVVSELTCALVKHVLIS